MLVGAGAVSLSGCISGLESGDDNNYATPTFEPRAKELGFNYEYVGDSDNGSMKSLVSNAGVYASDVNNNGLTDILALGGEKPILFRNTGDGFEHTNVLSMISGEVGSALFLDYDNDGWDELLLLRLGAPPVFLDNDNGEFTVRDVGFDDVLENPVGASAADTTSNGYLDVFIVQNGNWDDDRPARMSAPGAPDPDNGKPNVLYRGDGSSFHRVNNVGFDDTRWTLATALTDLTGNGHPDVYVANDYNYDLLYTNNGHGEFEAIELDSSNRNAMSATVADITGNGHLDVFVTNIYFDQEVEQALSFLPARPEGNNLFVNRGDGKLTDEASDYGVKNGGWGWAATISDFTNSGSTSLFHTTTPLGAEYTLQEETGQSLETIYKEYPYLAYPMFFERTDEGFVARHPPDLGFQQGDGRGVVAIDTTNNGQLDLVVTDVDGPYKIYENTSNTGNWIQIKVQPAESMSAIGTKVTVSASGDEQYQVVNSSADFLSQESRKLHFGVGDSESVELTVRYLDGTTYEFNDVVANQHVVVTANGDIKGR